MDGVILEQLRAEGVDIRETRSAWELLGVFRSHVRGAILYEL